jgi:SPP1 family predicted phage head-tail adaptor
VSAGTFRHFVRVLIPTTVDDGVGGQTVTWTNGPALWADIRPVSAREQAIAGAVQSIATHRLTMHYDDRITVERRIARIAPEGTTLQVLGVRDVEGRQRLIEVDCAEVV